MAEINTDGIISISPEAAKKLKETLEALALQDKKIADIKQQNKDLYTLLKDRYQLDPKIVKNMYKIHKKGDLNAVMEEQSPMDVAMQLYSTVYGLHRLGDA